MAEREPGSEGKSSAATVAKNSEALVTDIWKVLRKPGIRREAIFPGRSRRRVYAYSVLPADPTKIVREAADGTKTIGRLRSGVFRELKATKL